MSEHSHSSVSPKDECLDSSNGKETIPFYSGTVEETGNDTPVVKTNNYSNNVPEKNIAILGDSTSVKSFSNKDPPSDISPFKQAVKGFVLNKLSKKVGSSHLLSGLTEKLVKRLEDGKENVIALDSAGDKKYPTPYLQELHSEPPNEAIVNPCELKSVVANDLPDVLNVEEADECFEEVKSSVSDCCDRKPYLKPSKPISKSLPSSPARHFVRKSSEDLEISSDSEEKSSISESLNNTFSSNSLQILDIDTTKQKNDNEIELDIMNSSDAKDNTNVAKSHAYLDNVYSEEHKKEKSTLEKSTDIFISIRNVLESFPPSHIILIITLIIHNCNAFSAYYISYIFDGFVIGYIIYSAMTIMVHISLKAVSTAQSTKDELEISAIRLCEIDKTIRGSLKILKGEYDPEEKSHCTESVDVCIENQCLMISHVPSITPDSEESSSLMYEIYDLSGADISLVPENIKPKRRFRKRYPICIHLPVEQKSNTTQKTTEETDDENSDFVPLIPFQDGLLERPKRKALYLFALSDREKETWFWAFRNISKLPDSNKENLSPYADPQQLDATSVCYSSLLEKTSGENADEDPTETFHLKFSVQKAKTSLPFEEYMKTLFENYLRNMYSDLDNPSSDCVIAAYKSNDIGSEKSFPVAWINVVLGRLFYDALTQKHWSDYVMRKIQRKLDKIEMPSFMETLEVTDILMGSCIPQMHSVSNPVTDKFGLWVDFDITYDGSFQMTLKTKLKLPKVKDIPQSDSNEPLDEKHSMQDCESSDEDGASQTKRSKFINKIEKWISHKHFQTVAQNKFVKKYVGDLSNMLLTLTVEVHLLQGVLAVNLPPIPSDRVWYGFRNDPEISITASPKVGSHEINLSAIVKVIEQRLIRAFKKALVLPNMDDLMIPIMHSPLQSS